MIALQLLEQRVLVVGVRHSPSGWINVDRVVRDAGGGRGGHRAARQALDVLGAAGLVERDRFAGMNRYRRTPHGIEEAKALLERDAEELLRSLADEAVLGGWEPAPGDPRTLDEIVGQDAVRHRVRTNLDWAMRLGCLPASMLFTGPSGVGKSLVAKVVSRELGLSLIHISLADLAPQDLDEALETAADEGACLFLDELQAGRPALRDRLLVALDPARDIAFLPLGATTDAGALPAPLRRRFQLEVPFEEYDIPEAEEMARRRIGRIGLATEPNVPHLVARAGRSNPARITRLLTEVAMLVEGTGRTLSASELLRHLELTGRDGQGLDTTDVQVLLALRDEMGARPAGVGKLTATLKLDRGEIHLRLAHLRRARLVESRGTAGHTITADGRRYLSKLSY